MQVICDNDKRIIGYHIGYPGSCADSSVFKKMGIFHEPDSYFSPGEYLLADSAFGVSRSCIPAYKAPAANLSDNTDFNYCLSKSRVRVEHCIGILKSRWSSLREMRQQLRNKNEMSIFTSWVSACCILHNMLANLGDAWSDMYLNDEGRVSENPLHGRVPADAVNFRETLKKVTIETNLARGVLPICSYKA